MRSSIVESVSSTYLDRRVLVVRVKTLVNGELVEWSAYIGPVDDENTPPEEAASSVLRTGTKLPPRLASALYPNLPEKLYR